jgi:MFS family permease
MLRQLSQRLPFFYGWVVIAVAFVSMALAVNARTAFSLFFPPILDEFGWERGLTAGAFSFGFLVSAAMSPLMGRVMDRYGVVPVLQAGVCFVGGGLILAASASQVWHVYLSLGVLVGAGSVCLGYTGHGLFLPAWFVRHRGLALSIAFAGVGVGSILLLPALQTLIERTDWRTASWWLGILVIVILAPLNLLVRRRPESLGLIPDGTSVDGSAGGARRSLHIVDPQWAATDWTLALALRTARFWWISAAFFLGLYAWYSVQVHQTRYLLEIGFDAVTAAWALGLVSLVGIPGGIALGWLSDRIGREQVWYIGCSGFILTYFLLMALGHTPSFWLLGAMVLAQGLIGYGTTSVFGTIPAEVFEGRHYGAIFGTISIASISGGALGPWLTGFIHDKTGSYTLAFWIAIVASVASALCISRAAPGKIRAVPGRSRGLDGQGLPS